ncbi:uncharacterized protein LOC135500193 isoform X2 [Lineus longissimus]|uniref:uncharacterized protein LOC135500193 isoform X2 n=1 Tax=Lineus longissimus TaxID=88925 RepID=UPI00315D7092
MDTSDVVSLAFGLLFLINQGVGFKVSGPDAPLIVDRGQNITLNCFIKGAGFNGLHHTIQWVKLVKGGHNIISANTIVMTEIPSRYSIEIQTHTETLFDLQLKISGATMAENGTFVCEVLDQGGHKVKGNISRSVLVRDYISGIDLIYVRNGTNDTSNDMNLVMELEKPTDITCQTVGGNPVPRIHVYLGRGNENITDRFTKKTISVIHPYFINIWKMDFKYNYQLTCTTCKFRVEDNGKEIGCVATVPGLGSTVTTSKTLKLIYEPKITCPGRVITARGKTNFHIMCQVKANPAPHVIKWRIGKMNMRDGDTNRDFKVSQEKIDEDTFNTTLIINEVDENKFKNDYAVVARSSYGSSLARIILKEGSTGKPLRKLRDKQKQQAKGQSKGPVYSTIKTPPKYGHAGKSTHQGSKAISSSIYLTVMMAMLFMLLRC